MAAGQEGAPRTYPADTTRRAHAVSLEGWGTSTIASLNYERTVLVHERWSAIARVGFGWSHWRNFTRRFDPDVLLPFGMFVCYGRRLGIEAGGGGTVTSFVYPHPDTYEPQRIQHLHGWCSFGLRVEPAPRLFLRLHYVPILAFGRVDRTVGLWVGYRF